MTAAPNSLPLPGLPEPAKPKALDIIKWLESVRQQTLDLCRATEQHMMTRPMSPADRSLYEQAKTLRERLEGGR